MQIKLGENLLEIVYPDISVDTDNETCPHWGPADLHLLFFANAFLLGFCRKKFVR
jgi:hypothetical protein